jgi:alkylation response protein AidB-like acyl-CoA dehydrogenase
MTSAIDPIEAAAGILPRLRAVAEEGERGRRLPDEAVAAMREAGLSRLLAPKRYGGFELPLRAQILSCATTAHGYAAASWIQMVCGAHTYVLGSFPHDCQDEVFADPDVLIAGTLASQGTVERAAGGWRLNGRWQFCSGVDHSPWLLIGARQLNADADPDRVRNAHVVVPASEIRIDDTWYTLGLRGTGSKDIVAEDVFVPAHRAMPTGTLFTGRSPHAWSAMYRLPVLASLASMLAGGVLGMAERGFQTFMELTSVRRDIYAGGSKSANPGIQRRAAETSAELTTARLLVGRICDEFDAAMAADQPPLDVAIRGRLRYEAAYVVELCRRSMERLFAAAGAHAVYDSSELQRVQRDINTASHHAVVDFDGVGEMAGRILLGLDPGTPLV